MTPELTTNGIREGQEKRRLSNTADRVKEIYTHIYHLHNHLNLSDYSNIIFYCIFLSCVYGTFNHAFIIISLLRTITLVICTIYFHKLYDIIIINITMIYYLFVAPIFNSLDHVSLQSYKLMSWCDENAVYFWRKY